MGTNNRARRKAKQHKRDQKQSSQRRSPVDDLIAEIELLAVAGVTAIGKYDTKSFDNVLDMLADGTNVSGGRQLVDSTLFACAQKAVSSLWQRGWQPVDLMRAIDRERMGEHGRQVVIDVIAAENRQYAAVTVDERWARQLVEMGASEWWSGDKHYVSERADRSAVSRKDVLSEILKFLHRSDLLPKIQRLCPLPGEAPVRRRSHGADGSSDGGAGIDERMLSRIRALLAKAESTEFAEEADSFTVKAQDLMSRYSIDLAMLAASDRSGGDGPVARRVGIDDPYGLQKVLLLQSVADANRCRTVYSKYFGFCTVFGFEADLDMVEVLYTSLLVQATSAMTREGSKRDRFGRSKTRSFRQSFLSAYSERIGERLMTATEAASQEAAASAGRGSVLPVLVARERRVDDAVSEAFPDLSQHRMSGVTNYEGLLAGRAAADAVSLSVRSELEGPARHSEERG